MASVTIKVVFIPIIEGEYTEDVVVASDAASNPDAIAVTGIGYNVSPPEGTSETLSSRKRWDRLSMEWFNSFDYVQEIKDANPHISLYSKQSFYVDSGVKVIKPVIDEINNVGAVNQPDWRKV